MEKITVWPGTPYKIQWRAFYKNGLGNVSIVYGNSEHEAKAAALALYRKNSSGVSSFPIDMVVDRVEYIGN